MIEDQPSLEVCTAFGCEGIPHPLPGGEGRSFLVGSCVFKPIDNSDRYAWACEVLRTMRTEGFRIPKPIQTHHGDYVHQGWAATIFEPGEVTESHWTEKLDVSERFHSCLHAVAVGKLPAGEDIFTKAHSMAWQESPLPKTFHSKVLRAIDQIFLSYEPLERGQQIIHADICGNILFHESLPPCVIDFSPAIGTSGYAQAILVADATAWEGAPVELADEIQSDPYFRQLILRAINFRVIVRALFLPSEVNRVLRGVQAFLPLYDYVIGC